MKTGVEPALSVSSRRAAAGPIGWSSRSSNRSVVNTTCSPERTATSIAIRSASSLRAAKASASSEAASSQWASSTVSKSGVCSAAAANRLSTPTLRVRRSATAGGPTESTPSSAARCASGNASRCSASGRSRSPRPAKASWDSASKPRQASTTDPSAHPVAYSIRLDLPRPGSPRTTSTTLRPAPASSISRSISAHSASRS